MAVRRRSAVSLANAPRLVRVLLALLELHLDLTAVGRLEVVDETVELRAVVPDVEQRHGGVALHAAPVRVDRRRHGSVGPRWTHAVLAGGHHQAGGQARHVPLEGPGQCLVEVAQVEIEVALRRGPQPEVQDVGVTAELDLDPAVRSRRQVRGHDGGCAAVEVPRGQGHALVPQRHQLREPDAVLGRDRLNGVVPAVSARPSLRCRPSGPGPGTAGPPPGARPLSLPGRAALRRVWIPRRVCSRSPFRRSGRWRLSSPLRRRRTWERAGGHRRGVSPELHSVRGGQSRGARSAGRRAGLLPRRSRPPMVPCCHCPREVARDSGLMVVTEELRCLSIAASSPART